MNGYIASLGDYLGVFLHEHHAYKKQNQFKSWNGIQITQLINIVMDFIVKKYNIVIKINMPTDVNIRVIGLSI